MSTDGQRLAPTMSGDCSAIGEPPDSAAHGAAEASTSAIDGVEFLRVPRKANASRPTGTGLRATTARPSSDQSGRAGARNDTLVARQQDRRTSVQQSTGVEAREQSEKIVDEVPRLRDAQLARHQLHQACEEVSVISSPWLAQDFETLVGTWKS